MRYRKAVLVGLLGGILLAITVVPVEILISWQRLAASMQCDDAGTGLAIGCDGAVLFGDVRHLGIAFLVGFAVAFIWFRRRQRRLGG